MMKTVRLLTLVLVCLLAPAAALAETHYVDKGASGANNGTSWQNAWRSFADISWQQVAPGDTIFVSGGTTSKTYYEGLEIGKAGQSAAPIVIRVGQDEGHNGQVIMDGQDTVNYGVLLEDYITVDGEVDGEIRWICRNMRWTGFKATGADGIVIRYVEVDSCGSGTAPGGFDHGIHLQGANGCEVAYSYIHHNYQDGYNAGGSVGEFFGNNKVHHCRILWNPDDGVACRSGHDIHDNLIGDCWPQPGGGEGHPDGIQAQGNYTRIWNNEIYDCSTHCIFADPLNCGDARHIRIWNNLLYRTRDSMHSQAIRVKQESGTDSIAHILIANNTMVDFGYGAIDISSTATSDLIVQNNIVYNCRMDGAYGFTIGTDDDVGTIDYNCVNAGQSGGDRMKWNGTNYDYSQFLSNGFGQAHGQTGAPLFVRYDEMDKDESGHDLRLSADDTVCKGKGVDLSDYFSTDKDGKPRLTWDIGCYCADDGEGVEPPGDVHMDF